MMTTSRAQRALALAAGAAQWERTGTDGFRVPSSQPGRFYITTPNNCECKDWVSHTYEREACKHILAVRAYLSATGETFTIEEPMTTATTEPAALDLTSLLAEGEPWIYSARYQNPLLNQWPGALIRTTVGYPRFLKLGYKLTANIKEIAPYEIFNKGLSNEDFEREYRARLDGFGVEPIRALLREAQRAAGGGPIVLLCYENVQKGGFCHRTIFGAWFTEHSGEAVVELLEPEQVQAQTALL